MGEFVGGARRDPEEDRNYLQSVGENREEKEKPFDGWSRRW